MLCTGTIVAIIGIATNKTVLAVSNTVVAISALALILVDRRRP
jgi:hypothetical protein